MGGRKWTGATRRERAEPHGQFTGIDDFIARYYLKRHMDANETATMQESYWFWHGGIELYAGDQELDLSGPHQAV